MRYKILGNTGLRVSEVALGSGTLGTGWGWGADRTESKRLFELFAQAGGNFIDSAGGYQNGLAEQFIGEFIRAERASFVVTTKYTGPPTTESGANLIAATGNSRKSLIHALEATLRRLGSDYVDMLYVHFADQLTPTEEILRGLEDAVRAGKALFIGFSDFPAWRVARAATIAQLRGSTPVSAIQVEYSLLERSTERELLPMAEALGLTVTLWAILGGGVLSGKYRQGATEGRLSRGGGRILTESSPRHTRILDGLEAVARTMGVTPAQVAIAWVRATTQHRSTSVIPILGARTTVQLQDNLAAWSLQLPTEHLNLLNELSAIEAGFPHELLNSEMARQLASAGRWDQIDRPQLPVA
ncbi:MAG TPA: aldo/keto reductase [Steroidobacteraceae bacterium]|nr:aldo/keto reductase [Steroidobacteraceae bacterium]